MNYFLHEDGYNYEKTASLKPRLDCEEIFKSLNFKPLYYKSISNDNDSFFSRVVQNIEREKNLKKITRKLKKGDSLIVQHPLFRPTFFLKYILKTLNKRGIKTIVLIHDLNFLRLSHVNKLKKIFLFDKDISTLKKYKKIIVHNEKMKSIITDYGISSKKIVCLDIFDYLVSEKDKNENNKSDRIAIAGNLIPEKAGYCYALPENVSFNLYGINFNKVISKNGENVVYKGAFSPDEVELLEGKYGLVWDGNSIETCSGDFGNYLKFNNPHKASLYVAAGLPIIIWSKAALSDFVCKNKIGFKVDSLNEIHDKIDNITDDDYRSIKNNVDEISVKVRHGHYLTEALSNVGIKF
ncbi:MAG: galactofuranosyltransferase [Liquorilactobacillus hordei]|uniref:galactofuranosyltransferase n=1 Tax=Liquorilactobacillus hordei TaxID=468911 RepID=UPI0039E730A3